MSLYGNVIGFATGHLLHLSGGTMEGPINMNGHELSGLGEPASDNDAATKKYTDKETGAAKKESKEYTEAHITKRMVHRGGSKNLFDIREAVGSNSGVQVSVTRWLSSDITGDYPEGYGLRIESTVAGTNQCAQVGCRLKGGVTYTISAELLEGAYGYVRFAFRDANTKSILKSTPRLDAAGKYSVSYTPAEDIDVNFSFFITSGTSQIGSATFWNIMVEEGDVATEYVPYHYSIEQLTDLMSTLLGVSE